MQDKPYQTIFKLENVKTRSWKTFRSRRIMFYAILLQGIASQNGLKIVQQNETTTTKTYYDLRFFLLRRLGINLFRSLFLFLKRLEVRDAPINFR